MMDQWLWSKSIGCSSHHCENLELLDFLQKTGKGGWMLLISCFRFEGGLLEHSWIWVRNFKKKIFWKVKSVLLQDVSDHWGPHQLYRKTRLFTVKIDKFMRESETFIKDLNSFNKRNSIKGNRNFYKGFQFLR